MSNQKNKVTKQGNDKNSILIDNFNKIRDIVRVIYLYSSYNNKEVFNVSDRKLREEKKRIKEMFPIYCKDNYENNKKYVGLCYDAVIYSKNFLAQAYFIKTFTDLDLMLYFFILGTLNMHPMCIESILDEYEKFIYNKDSYKSPGCSTLDRHIKRLLEDGLIDRIKNGKKFLYKTKKEFFKEFSLDQKEAILNTVIFYSEITPYKVPGHYLQETLKSDSEIMSLNYYDNKNIYSNWYYFSGNHIHNILDEIVLFDIEKYRFIKVIKNDGINIKVCYLYKIMDPKYGRLFALTREINDDNLITDNHIILRVDRIEKVVPLKKKPKNVNQIDFDHRLKMWNCSIPPHKTRSLELETVQAVFYFDEIEDKHMYERLLNEKKWATLEKQSDGGYLFTIDVMDKNEMVPWFRTFEGYVVVLDEYINKKFKKERNELLKRYGVF